MKYLLCAIAMVGCSGGEPLTLDASVDARPRRSDAPATATFKLSSPALVAGEAYRIENTCDGANTSPTLLWQGAPAATKSLAVVLTDKSDGTLLWVIYDIPGSSVNLPPAIQNAYAPTNVLGAHQPVSWQGMTRGYRGPCPPQGDPAHPYQLAIYALDTAQLPGAATTTTRMQAYTTITQHQLDMATLAGTYAR